MAHQYRLNFVKAHIDDIKPPNIGHVSAPGKRIGRPAHMGSAFSALYLILIRVNKVTGSSITPTNRGRLSHVRFMGSLGHGTIQVRVNSIAFGGIR
jgi:hypothetical protein